MKLTNKVKKAVIEASTTFREDQFYAYQNALKKEKNKQASWILELLIENARIAQEKKVPLCDDTGVPHILVEMGKNAVLPANFLGLIKEGVKEGLKKLPGRPMAVKGNGIERIEQKNGLYTDPSKVVAPSIILDEDYSEEKLEEIEIHVLMLGGGPEIRANTYHVFHKRNYENILNSVINHLELEIPKLGCTPCIPSIGIGRTHFEATTLMIKAMIHGNLKTQSRIETRITELINNSNIGPLGIGGSVTALGSLVKIGPQRASGVRIICMRPCCCVEPRLSSFKL